jgi:hypothetical protein
LSLSIVFKNNLILPISLSLHKKLTFSFIAEAVCANAKAVSRDCSHDSHRRAVYYVRLFVLKSGQRHFPRVNQKGPLGDPARRDARSFMTDESNGGSKEKLPDAEPHVGSAKGR